MNQKRQSLPTFKNVTVQSEVQDLKSFSMDRVLSEI